MPPFPPLEPPTDSLAVDAQEASRLTGLSAKTLERLATSGEPVGRIKVGRRVLFIRSALLSWLASKLTAPIGK